MLSEVGREQASDRTREAKTEAQMRADIFKRRVWL